MACQRLNEIPKGDPATEEIGSLIKSVNDAEGRVLEVVQDMEREGIVRKRFE